MVIFKRLMRKYLKSLGLSEDDLESLSKKDGSPERQLTDEEKKKIASEQYKATAKEVLDSMGGFEPKHVFDPNGDSK
jgi:cytoskeletal protein RodZ